MEDESLPSSMRDVIRPPKRYFVVLGPDQTNLSSIKHLDIQIATIQTDKTNQQTKIDEEEEKGDDEEDAYEIDEDDVSRNDLNLTQIERSPSEADFLYAGEDKSYDDDYYDDEVGDDESRS